MDEEKVTELKKKRQPSGTVPYTVSHVTACFRIN